MSLSILNVGCGEEDVLLLREVARTETGTPLVHSVLDPAEALEWASMHRPHLIVVDARGVAPAALDFIRQVRRASSCDDIPILTVVDEYRRDDRGDLVVAGASDLLTAPLDPYECQARVLNLIELGMQRRQLRDYRRRFGVDDKPVALSAREHKALRQLTGDSGGKALSVRVRRLRQLSRAIAEELRLPESQCDVIEVAAPMHDIGNVAIPDSTLQKPGKLTAAERKEMQAHTVIGHSLLRHLEAVHLQCAADIALSHHERYDGNGYPRGIGGEDIPLPARIVAVADVYDALSSPRSYRDKWPPELVQQYMQEQRGKHFDPRCVDALLFSELGKAQHL